MISEEGNITTKIKFKLNRDHLWSGSVGLSCESYVEPFYRHTISHVRLRTDRSPNVIYNNNINNNNKMIFHHSPNVIPKQKPLIPELITNSNGDNGINVSMALSSNVAKNNDDDSHTDAALSTQSSTRRTMHLMVNVLSKILFTFL